MNWNRPCARAISEKDWDKPSHDTVAVLGKTIACSWRRSYGLQLPQRLGLNP